MEGWSEEGKGGSVKRIGREDGREGWRVGRGWRAGVSTG